MSKTKNILKWIGSVFFLLSTLIYFPSVTSIFMVVLGLFLMPIPPIQNLIKKVIKAKWLRVTVAVVLFLVAMYFVPSEPVDPNLNKPTDTTGSSYGETVDNTTDNSANNTTEETDSTTESTESTQGTTDSTNETQGEKAENITSPVVTPPQNSSFEVHFIDVGQADAALILCDGKAMLVDGGNVSDSSKLYTYLKKQNVTHLDYVVGTHAHEDHIGGIAGALNYASVGTAYCPVTSYTTNAFDNFVKAVQKHNTSITVPSVGTTFSLGSASCKVLAVNTSSDTNNSSIVLRITYGETSFLFTGDAEREVEQVVLDRGETLKSTVLKVGHHGSETSTSYVWLREIMPEYAIISVGTGNSYGHPTEEVLSRLRDADVKTFRTDMQGDIICISNGKTVTITPSRNSSADVFGGIGGNSTQKPAGSDDQQQSAGAQETQKPNDSEATQKPDSSQNEGQQGTHYVLNTNSKKFHYEDCHSAKKISDKNREDYYGTREDLIDKGYSPCGNCDP